MRIQLYDRGSPRGKKLFTDLVAICKRFQVEDDPEYVKDMSRAYALGLQCQTALVINSEVVFVDRYPSPKELESIISDYI